MRVTIDNADNGKSDDFTGASRCDPKLTCLLRSAKCPDRVSLM
jgi:hypothetical protein